MPHKTNKKRLLFTGVIAPDTVHGVSVSNKINIDILREDFEIDINAETLHHDSTPNHPISKGFHFIKSIIHFLGLNISRKYDALYLNISLSSAGILKTFLMAKCFSLLNSRSHYILHLHRGDVIKFVSQNAIHFWLVSHLLQKASVCFVLSESVVEYLEQTLKISRDQLYVLDNTIDAEPSETKYETEKNTFTFLYLSDYRKEKGILNLLATFDSWSKNHPNCQLKCFGKFTDSHIKHQILAYQSPQISINERISGDEKFSEYRKANCFLFVSENEGKPLVILEAMFAGLPIISTNVGFISEILPLDYPFLFSVGDSELFIQHLETLISNSEIHHPISQKLRDQYWSRFSRTTHQKNLRLALKKIF
ncbi:MAG: glycosyltransferase family 4 protein [Bacteroidetes bacterium]|nr:glycosyltransferase family 4 protein [Bacteroidota bacterium]MBS1739500.1 glycosyltransferase family 4 protein [Bacteroidota bacterium]